MREILFRGKRVHNGEWLHGYYKLSGIHIGTIEEEMYPTISLFKDIRAFEVDPKTLGQFTGLTDKNGQKIFEGDIIRAKIEGGNHSGFTWPNMPVGFQEGSFCLNDRKGHIFSVLGAFAASVTFEVIGNIHDNPELLEG